MVPLNGSDHIGAAEQETGLARILVPALVSCPQQDAIIFGQWHISYQQFGQYIIQTAHWLISHGVRRGDRVGIISRNRPEFLIVEFALYKLGAVAVKINWRLGPEEIVHQLDNNGVRLAFIQIEDPHWGQLLMEHYGPRLDFFLFEGTDEESSTLLEVIRDCPHRDFHLAIDPGETACHMHTSGTTGQAKAVICTHGGLLNKIETVHGMYGYRPGEKLQYITQLFHSGAIGAWLCFYTRGTLVLMSSFSTQEYLRSIERERVSSISIIPTILKWILDELDRQPYDLSSLHTIRYSTCPVPPVLLRRAMEKLDCSFYQSYGMTEMGSIVTILSPQDHLEQGMAHLGSVGKPIPGTEIRILDENGCTCAPGQTGEVTIRSPDMMLGYYGQPRLSAEKLKGGWYHSGDMGYLDSQGYLTISGRKDDLMISGGENIYPSEITNVLMRLDQVAECCAFGIPDETWGERVMACVTLVPGKHLSVGDILAYCRKEMPHFKAPKEVRILDALPKNASGKVMVRQLKELYLKSSIAAGT